MESLSYIKKLPSPILITGAARSGTSLVAGAINLCGAFGGNMSGPNRNNQKGMFENNTIRNNILKPYLRELGVDSLGQYPLPVIEKLLIPTDLKNKVERVMINEGYCKGAWMYKGAKMCLTWPIWNYAFPDAKWIIVRRNTCDIVNSCLKTSFMRAFQRQAFRNAIGVKSEYNGWVWWVQQHEKRFIEMMNTGLNIKIIWPERMVNGDYSQLMDAIQWLGLKWNSKVLSFVDPKLWKARGRTGNKPTPYIFKDPNQELRKEIIANKKEWHDRIKKGCCPVCGKGIKLLRCDSSDLILCSRECSFVLNSMRNKNKTISKKVNIGSGIDKNRIT
jgi:hypothetical protein